METLPASLNGLIVLKPDVFMDNRGVFFESYAKRVFSELGIEQEFVQDNQSVSNKGVLRGMHFQNPPHAQGKLVRVVQGKVQDVVIDIRKASPTYGRHFSVILSDENHKMLWIPPGFAHGFLALEDQTVFVYKCTDYYCRDAEGCILWNDVSLHINWEIAHPLISEKDAAGEPFHSFKSLF